MLKVIFLIILSTLLDSAGQLFFKTGVNSIEKRGFGDLKGFISFLGSVLKNINIWCGVLSYTFDLIIWLMALSLVELSFIFPFSSINYIFVIIGSRVLLKEKISPIRWLGAGLIFIGILFVSSS